MKIELMTLWDEEGRYEFEFTATLTDNPFGTHAEISLYVFDDALCRGSFPTLPYELRPMTYNGYSQDEIIQILCDRINDYRSK